MSTHLSSMRSEDKHRQQQQHHYQHQHHHHRLLSFHFHMPQLGHGQEKGMTMRKGWMGIRVGQEGEDQQRFVVPVDYLRHPLFLGLLDQAEKEYGFEHEGAITIPCGVDHFRHVQGIIDRDTAVAHHGGHHHHHHHNHHHHHHLPHFAGCFRA